MNNFQDDETARYNRLIELLGINKPGVNFSMDNTDPINNYDRSTRSYRDALGQGEVVLNPYETKHMTTPVLANTIAHEYGHLIDPKNTPYPVPDNVAQIPTNTLFYNYNQQLRERAADRAAMEMIARSKIPIKDLFNKDTAFPIYPSDTSSLSPLATHPSDIDRVNGWKQQAMTPQILTLLAGRGADGTNYNY